MALVEKKSFCRICGSGCGIVVELDGERVIRVQADTAHPVSRGYTCPKGRAIAFDHHREERLERPMIRRDGELVAAGWDEVLDDLAVKLTGIVATTGPVGVGTFIGGGGFPDASGFWSLLSFLKTIGTPSAYSDMTIDSVSKVLAGEMVAGIPGPPRERPTSLVLAPTSPETALGRWCRLQDSSL